jgi:hypothetical protein
MMAMQPTMMYSTIGSSIGKRSLQNRRKGRIELCAETFNGRDDGD